MESLVELTTPLLRACLVRSLALLIAGTATVWAQPPQPATPPQQRPARRVGGFVPGQQRPPGDPAQIERGKASYGISCRGCHGADLRGGDMGGPNLLRSQLSLSDRDGENIIPFIQGSVPGVSMPAIPMSLANAKAVAAYVRSVLATIGGQGMPPTSQEPPSILVGNAVDGKLYFASKCSGCHSETGDLRGIATRVPDPKTLQNAWVAGGVRARRGGPAATQPSERRTITVTVTPPGEPAVEGRLLRIDDFVVTAELPDGSSRSFRRDGDVPKVEVHDPLSAHRDLYQVYTDKDMHNVTAFLVTLK